MTEVPNNNNENEILSSDVDPPDAEIQDNNTEGAIYNVDTVEEAPSDNMMIDKKNDIIPQSNTTVDDSHQYQHFQQLKQNESVEIIHQEDREPEISKFVDHFTLLIPSSTIRYRDGRAAARVLEANDAQFVLEETYHKKKDHHTVSIRRIHDTSEGVRFLRTSYLIVTAFWTGFLFVFCLQILLFLFLDLAIQAGATSKQPPNWGKAIGKYFLIFFKCKIYIRNQLYLISFII
jgi:hypothetical protein